MFVTGYSLLCPHSLDFPETPERPVAIDVALHTPGTVPGFAPERLLHPSFCMDDIRVRGAFARKLPFCSDVGQNEVTIAGGDGVADKGYRPGIRDGAAGWKRGRSIKLFPERGAGDFENPGGFGFIVVSGVQHTFDIPAFHFPERDQLVSRGEGGLLHRFQRG